MFIYPQCQTPSQRKILGDTQLRSTQKSSTVRLLIKNLTAV